MLHLRDDQVPSTEVAYEVHEAQRGQRLCHVWQAVDEVVQQIGTAHHHASGVDEELQADRRLDETKGQAAVPSAGHAVCFVPGAAFKVTSHQALHHLRVHLAQHAGHKAPEAVPDDVGVLEAQQLHDLHAHMRVRWGADGGHGRHPRPAMIDALADRACFPGHWKRHSQLETLYNEDYLFCSTCVCRSRAQSACKRGKKWRGTPQRWRWPRCRRPGPAGRSASRCRGTREGRWVVRSGSAPGGR